MMREKRQTMTAGLREYRRRHSKFSSLQLAFLRMIMTEERYFQKVVMV